MSKKFIAIISALALVVTLLAPVGVQEASAATTYSAVDGPKAIGKTGETELNPLYIKIDPQITDSSALISLPSDFKITNVDISADGVTGAVYANHSNVTGTDLTSDVDLALKDNEIKIIINKPPTPKKQEVYVTFKGDPQDKFSSGAEINATITSLSGQLNSAKVTLAKVDSGSFSIATSTPKNFSAKTTVEFTLRENLVNGLERVNESVKLSLPSNFSWSKTAGNKAVLDSNDTLAGNAAIADTKVSDNGRDLYLTIDNSGGGKATDRSVIRFKATVEANRLKASYGEVYVTVGGESDYEGDDLHVGTFAQRGLEAEAIDEKELLAGDKDKKIGTIVIEEMASKTLREDDYIYLTLPSGAKWDKSNNDKNVSNEGLEIKGQVETDDARVLRFEVKKESDNPAKLQIKDLKVNLAPNFTGDLEVRVQSDDGRLDETVKVASVNARVNVTADLANLKVGVQGQEAGKLVFEESKKGALVNGKTFYIKPSLSGVYFDGTPTLEITSENTGIDLELDRVNSELLVVEVKSESNKPATFEISGINYTFTRSFPEGNVELEIFGEALDKVNDYTDSDVGEKPKKDSLFADRYIAAKVANAKIVTPAPGGERAVVEFAIDSTEYVVDGVPMTMDVAPYIKDSRTFLPVFFVAQALGVDANNIIWEPHSKTVTVIKGDRVAQMQIGSNTLTVNGVALQMDTAPEIKDGRTMLPIFFIGQALGASVEWDGDTRTVTVTQ